MRPTVTLETLRASVGGPPTPSDWLLIDQARIDAFAQVTGDDAFIHIDPERARQTRFGGTIAHGLLTLSLLPLLLRTATPLLEGSTVGVNYGYDRIRFLVPVPVDSRIRALIALAELDEAKPNFVRLGYDVSVEIEGGEEPALVARWLLGRWMKSKPRPA